MLAKTLQLNKPPIQTTRPVSNVSFKRTETRNCEYIGVELEAENCCVQLRDKVSPKAQDRQQLNQDRFITNNGNIQENLSTHATTIVNSNPFTPNEYTNPHSKNSRAIDQIKAKARQIGSNSNNSYSSDSKESHSANRSVNEKNTSKTNSSSNSNSNSYVKTKPNSINKKHSDHKTESTNISNGTSPSPNIILDCDETLHPNFLQQADIKTQPETEKYNFRYNFEAEFSSLQMRGYGVREPLMETSKPALSKKPMTLEEELKNFNPDIHPCAFDSNTISFLIAAESEYAPDPHYFEKKQKHVTKSMRTILMDWMMEVSNEFTLKRETFHYSINYVDRYLSAASDVEKWELQLIGVTAMHMASKVEVISMILTRRNNVQIVGNLCSKSC